MNVAMFMPPSRVLSIGVAQVVAGKYIYLNAVKKLYPKWLEEAKEHLVDHSYRCV
jgi:hypothetical protein